MNGFRKHEGSIGDTARVLVTKWKSLVASEPPSIKCETVSTTNYHCSTKAGASDESIRAPYLDSHIRKAPYMDRPSTPATDGYNNESTVVDGEIQHEKDRVSEGSARDVGTVRIKQEKREGGDSRLNNESVDVSKSKERSMEKRVSSHENNKSKTVIGNNVMHEKHGKHDAHGKYDNHGKHDTHGKYDKHGKHDKHKHGKHDRHGKDRAIGGSTKDVGMVQIKQEKLEGDRHHTETRRSQESGSFKRTATVNLGLVKQDKNDPMDELPDLEVPQVSVKVEKEDTAFVNNAHVRLAHVRVDLGRVKQEPGLRKPETSSHEKSQRQKDTSRKEKTDLGRVKCEPDAGLRKPEASSHEKSGSGMSQRSNDTSRKEKSDKHHKRSKERHGHKSSKGDSEKIHEHKSSVGSVYDGSEDKGNDSHNSSANKNSGEYEHQSSVWSSILDGDENKGNDSHHGSANEKIKKYKVHDMSDDDDDAEGKTDDRLKSKAVENKKDSSTGGRTEVKLSVTTDKDPSDNERSASVNDASDDGDNAGMSFDDFLNYDASAVKSLKKNKKAGPAIAIKTNSSSVVASKAPASSGGKRREAHKSHSSSSSSHSKSKHQSMHSGDKHRSKAKAGSTSGSHSKHGGKTEKNKAEFTVPEPKKQVCEDAWQLYTCVMFNQK